MPPEILCFIHQPYTQQFQQILTAKSKGFGVVTCSYNTYQERESPSKFCVNSSFWSVLLCLDPGCVTKTPGKSLCSQPTWLYFALHQANMSFSPLAEGARGSGCATGSACATSCCSSGP